MFGCGNNSCIWIILIIILVFCCGNNGCGSTFSNNNNNGCGCGCDNGCC